MNYMNIRSCRLGSRTPQRHVKNWSTIFNSKRSIRIETNASNMIIKTCLCQKYDDKWYSVVYFSKKLTSAEQNYEIHDKELLIIVTVLKTWKIYAKKNVRTHHIDESQKSFVFHHHEKIESNKMTAESGFEQKKMSDPTLGSISYNWIRSKIEH